MALVALDRDDIIGVGRFDALGDGQAEVAFLIRDDMQGLGLGSVLLEHLAAAGRERGITRFVAEVLPANSRMLSTFRAAGYALTQQREDDVIAVGFDIEPTAASLAVMSAREHRAEARSMARMLRPQSVAVVGASRTGTGLGSLILRNLVEGGFRGRLVAVHREADELAGVPCVRSLSDLDEAIDLVVVVIPAGEVPDLLADAAAAEVHGLVVVSSVDLQAAAASRRSPAPACAWSARTPSASSTPTPRCGSTPPWCPPCRSAAAWASSASPGRWGAPSWSGSPSEGSACPASCRRATGQTSPATTSCSTGRRTQQPTSCCCTSRPSATPASSHASSIGWPAASR